jgi:hypothetical protein
MRRRSAYPTESRTTQSASVTAKITTQTQTIASLLGAQPNQRPHAAETNSQGAAARASSPSNVPPAFAPTAEATSPRIR